MPTGRRAGLAVVVDSTPPPTILTLDRKLRRLTVVEGEPVVVGQLRIPKTFSLRSPTARRDLASSLRNLRLDPGPRPQHRDDEDEQISRLRAQLRGHPVHGCPDREDHVRLVERYRRLQAEVTSLQRRIESRTNTIARTFDRVCALLEQLGYLRGGVVTDAGRMLAGIYAESDLLVAECVRRGTWSELAPAELAAVASAVVYEARRDEGPPAWVPGGRVRATLTAMAKLHVQLAELEAEHKLAFVREPEPGFVGPVYRWASGRPLDVVLDEGELAAGDFVRWVKQTIDLVDQLRAAAPALTEAARQAVALLRRGVVAYSSIG
jgi:ATP-dependent RNA helicase HelY